VKATQFFFIEGQLIDRVEREVNDHCHSYVFVCECCGEVYAKTPLSSSVGTWHWEAVTGRCSKESPHKLYGFVPGSIMTKHWDKPFIDALPMPVLQWELERHIQAYERIHDENFSTK